jgi:Uma2 family endonuclease
MNAPFTAHAPFAVFNPHRFSVANYYRMSEVGILPAKERTELIDGEIIEMSPIGSEHAATVNKSLLSIYDIIGRQVEYSTQGPLKLGDDSLPQPDLMLLAQRDGGYFDKLPEAADVLLLIEVAQTTLAYDRGPKLALYAKYEIAEVWIVNLVSTVIECYRDPVGGEYRTKTTHERDAILKATKLPGFDIPALDILGT